MKSLLKVIPDLTALVILVAASIKLLYNLDNVTDIDLFDESYYLLQGVNLFKAPAVASWGPLYSTWYWLLSLFQPERVALYLLNAKLIVVLPVFTMYAALRRYSVSILLSLAASLWLLSCNGNVATAPKVVHFAVSVVFIGLIFMKSAKNIEQLLLIATITSLVVSFVRPEFFLAYIASVSVFLILIMLRFFKAKPVVIPKLLLATLLVLSFSSLYFVGPPAFFSVKRDMSAFSQHFSAHWVKWTGSKLHPYANAPMIMQKVLNNPASVLEAFKNNPKLVLRHCIENIGGVAPALNEMFKVKVPIFAEHSIILMFEATMTILMLCALFLSKLQQIISGIIRSVNEYWKQFLFIGLLISITATTVAIIFPHHHYLFFFVSMFIFSVSLVLNGDSKLKIRSAYLLPAGVFAVVALVPNYAGNDWHVPYEINTIRFFQSLPNKDVVYLDDKNSGYDVYVPQLKRVTTRDKGNNDFISFLHERNISVILLGARMNRSYEYIIDPSWQNFTKNYGNYGFVKINVPRGRKEILVKENFIQGSNSAKSVTIPRDAISKN